jgi:hypothetical protein
VREGVLYTVVGMLISAATMEISMEVPQETKNRTTIRFSHTTPGIYTPWYISKTAYHIETFACPCLLQYYSQQPSCIINLGAHQWMNGS